MFDNVPQARIYKIWNVPERDTEAAAHFDLASSILVGGKNSPLYKELVYKTNSNKRFIFLLRSRDCRMFFITADVVSGVDPCRLLKQNGFSNG